MQQHFIDEIFAQPDALLDLLAYYESHPLRPLVAQRDDDIIVLTGMGASYHAASIAAYQFQRRHIFAQVLEAIHILNYPSLIASKCKTLVYISQSGASGEVVPVLSSFSPAVDKIGITNNVESPLSEHSDLTLPLCAGQEFTVATKTYINSLALLALLAGVDPKTLRDISARIPQLLASAAETRVLWLENLGALDTLYFVGHGPHAITARQCAMMVGEWAKRPAIHASIGAFRHGFLEAIGSATGVVIFAPAGVSQESACELANELTSYGATVLLVENGQTRRPKDTPTAAALEDEFLSPMLDVIPVQLFVEAYARELGVEAGFRYISKVVKHL